jgi:preprotein translocase subunit SecY
VISSLGNAFRIADVRKRLLITAFILALYRLGSWLPAPGVNPSTVRDLFNQSGTGTILG